MPWLRDPRPAWVTGTAPAPHPAVAALVALGRHLGLADPQSVMGMGMPLVPEDPVMEAIQGQLQRLFAARQAAEHGATQWRPPTLASQQELIALTRDLPEFAGLSDAVRLGKALFGMGWEPPPIRPSR